MPPRLRPELRPSLPPNEAGPLPPAGETRAVPRPDLARVIGNRAEPAAAAGVVQPIEPALRVNPAEEGKPADTPARERPISFGRSDFSHFRQPSPAPSEQYSASLADVSEQDAADLSLSDIAVSPVLTEPAEPMQAARKGLGGLGTGAASPSVRSPAPLGPAPLGEQSRDELAQAPAPRAEAPVAPGIRRELRPGGGIAEARGPAAGASGLGANAAGTTAGEARMPRLGSAQDTGPRTFEELAERNRRSSGMTPAGRTPTGDTPVWPSVSRGPAARAIPREGSEQPPVFRAASAASAAALADEQDGHAAYDGGTPGIDDGYRGAHARELRQVEDGSDPSLAAGVSGQRRPSAAEYQEAYREYESRMERPSFLEGRMPYYLGAGALSVIVIIGLAVYMMRGSSTVSLSDTPPVIAAPTQPAKIQPEEGAQEPIVPRQSKLIYDRILGDNPGTGEERLVPRQEEPLMPAMPNGEAEPEDQGALPPAVPPPPTGNQSSITDGDTTIAAASAMPGEGASLGDDGRLTGFPLPGQGASADAPAEAEPVPSPAEAAARPTTPLPKPKPAIPRAPTSSPAPAAVAASQQGPVVLTAPGLPATPTVQAAASGQQVALATPGQTPAVSAAGQYLIQLASFRTQQDAATEFNRLKRSFPQLLGNLSPFIQEADLGARGKFYRLRIGPLASQEGASQLCNTLIASGEKDCLVRRQ
ncbi:SPOR domain-containing protein [Rhodoligotrophos defluvii]|uniref:SPOR domain-containing protein n=1 Tax=Rhodoligotrophos defluvii TaxID=2561934 RepID=UPI00148579E4|nr:SPOR domain-containing protein [Rhodoligotrophos defluvii]